MCDAAKPSAAAAANEQRLWSAWLAFLLGSMAFFMALLSSSLVCLVYMLLLGQKAAFKNAKCAHFRPHLFSTTISLGPPAFAALAFKTFSPGCVLF